MMNYRVENFAGSHLNYRECAALLRSGSQPYIAKTTPYGDVICQLSYEADDHIVADVCVEELSPEVYGNLNVLLESAMDTGLNLVMRLYPGGTYNLTLQALPETEVWQIVEV